MADIPRPKKLLDQMRDALRTQHYSMRTENAYVDWARRFILFHHKRHPKEMDQAEIEAFLTHLAVKQHVAASTQNQALSALLYLYRTVLNKPIDTVAAMRARKPHRLPVVLTRAEAQLVLGAMAGIHQLMARLLYGSGLRLMECLRLRVKDIDFEQRAITVRDGKGAKDRLTLLPESVIGPLRDHLTHVQLLHANDLQAGFGSVYLPYALERKHPHASRDWIWQDVFPAKSLSTDPRTEPSSATRRHHLDESGLQRAVRQAAQLVGLTKPVSCHTFRHSFATHLLEAGSDIAPHSGERETQRVSPGQAQLAPAPCRSFSDTKM